MADASSASNGAGAVAASSSGNRHTTGHCPVLGQYVVPTDVMKKIQEARAARIADLTGKDVQVGSRTTLGQGQNRRKLHDRGMSG